MVNEFKSYQFSYNKAGEIIPPQPASTAFGTLLLLFGFATPLIPYLHAQVGLSPMFIGYFPSFWALKRAGYVSNGELALIEVSTLVWLTLRVVHCALFRNRLLSFFSEANPPPIDLQARWPIQFSGFLKIGGLLFAAPLALGPSLLAEGAFNPRYAFYLDASFGGGCIFVTEGLASLGLYLTFRSRFWHHRRQG